MTNHYLEPNMAELRKEYVLVQAWKKTSNYIRYHNWYADTLELDWATANLREFINEIGENLENPEKWKSGPLRVVPAPKHQLWRVTPKSKRWGPARRGVENVPLRPLAHVNLRDQVVATAIMLCLADRVETKQGESRNSIHEDKRRKNVISYGNRLFCDSVDGKLRYRWGSTKLYSAYFEDYRSFVSRPAWVAESVEKTEKQRVFIVESDLSKFYDRVRPHHLLDALRTFQHGKEEELFFDFAARVFDWGWHSDDTPFTNSYALKESISDFDRVALPQGLVSAGFFANVVLLPLDEELRNYFGKEIKKGFRLEDACRYVDDLRFVVSTESGAQECQEAVVEWLNKLLHDNASGLHLSENKTKAAEFGGSERPFVRQGSRMERIQSAISVGFDVAEGEAILDAIQGLLRSQQALRRSPVDSGWAFSPVPDVREETVARFAANRFRLTYRSIRPLLEEKIETDPITSTPSESEYPFDETMLFSKENLDEEAKDFALSLIERWIEDPSNVRLLRIGLDIWPDHEILRAILDLLWPLVKNANRKEPLKRVAWYCLSEILRAGATETGLVEDQESLPNDIDVQKYRETLRDEALRLIQLPPETIPWYLRQQALLFLAVFDPDAVPYVELEQQEETVNYRNLIQFLQGENSEFDASDFAILAIIARESTSNVDETVALTRWFSNAERKNQIAIRNPSFAIELSQLDSRFFEDLSPRVQEDLGFQVSPPEDDFQSLTDIVLKGGPMGPLRDELSLLQFASKFLGVLQNGFSQNPSPITPTQVIVKLNYESDASKISCLKVLESPIDADGSLYMPPIWCAPNDAWRFQLGFLLRFILSRRPDFTTVVRSSSWKDDSTVYRQVKSHWLQRIYGFFNGQEAFGDDWLPISDWMEGFLLALLRWPGCLMSSGFEWVYSDIDRVKENIDERIGFLLGKKGSASETLLMPMIAEWPTQKNRSGSLRACVVQTVIPKEVEKDDVTLSNHDIRRTHQNHLSAALAAVRQMLRLRATHSEEGGFLDWLILPELAVHPQDVKRHLIPFARAYRTLILAGLTYEEIFQNRPAVNSALWIMPKWSKDHGWQFQTRRQGKKHLNPHERELNVQSFRPCQWLVGYKRTNSHHRPLWVTSAICYDATDLNLVADLKNVSDVLAIPSFNKDVKTFDQMALALHYHMFQLVVVANNGLFGGSNAYWPLHKEFNRQIFHLHGQPQATIALFEINDIEDFLARGNNEDYPYPRRNSLNWKTPPAGWKPQR